MDLASVASSTSNNISDSGVSQTVQVDLIKRAINIDQQSAAALIQAIPPAPAVQSPSVQNLPSNLGNSVNTSA